MELFFIEFLVPLLADSLALHWISKVLFTSVLNFILCNNNCLFTFLSPLQLGYYPLEIWDYVLVSTLLSSVMSCLGPCICAELNLTGQLLNNSWIIWKILIHPPAMQHASKLSFIIFRFFFRECKLSLISFSAFLNNISHMQTDSNNMSFKIHAYINFEECLWHGEILKEIKMLMMHWGTRSLRMKVHVSTSDLALNSPVWRRLRQGGHAWH